MTEQESAYLRINMQCNNDAFRAETGLDIEHIGRTIRSAIKKWSASHTNQLIATKWDKDPEQVRLLLEDDEIVDINGNSVGTIRLEVYQ